MSLLVKPTEHFNDSSDFVYRRAPILPVFDIGEPRSPSRATWAAILAGSFLIAVVSGFLEA